MSCRPSVCWSSASALRDKANSLFVSADVRRRYSVISAVYLTSAFFPLKSFLLPSSFSFPVCILSSSKCLLSHRVRSDVIIRGEYQKEHHHKLKAFVEMYRDMTSK